VNDLGVIDQFTDVFSRYIDTGFGLLRGEVGFLTATLVVIDMTLAGLFWAMGNEEVIAKLIKKTLYVGAFAFILTNFNQLSNILFRSFAGLGLLATGSALTQAQFLQPGHIAGVGVLAGQGLMTQIGQLSGFPDVFLNLDTIVVLFIAWLIVLLSFFILAVQLFVTLIEFKLTTLAGFVLVPFALWNKTAFLAERVLGSVVAAGVKVLVLAVIVGIGGGLFAQFGTAAGTDPTLDNALAMMLGAMALLGLGIFGPGIATGLVSGAPQLGAGAAAGTALGLAGLALAGAATAGGAARVARSGVGAASSLASGARTAYSEGVAASGASGAAGVKAGVTGVARAGADSAAERFKSVFRPGSAGVNEIPDAPEAKDIDAPEWAQRLKRREQISRGLSTAVQTIRSADRGGSGASPSLDEKE
jgi:type IV secretion system protein TrbL